MKQFQATLDKYTMYQVVVTVLSLLVFASFTLSVVGVLKYSILSLLLSLTVITGVALAAHYVLAWHKKAPANVWSTIITALILFLLFTPGEGFDQLFVLGAVSLLAIVSKYYVQYRHMHIINPVVLAAVVGSTTGLAYASWWVGSEIMFPYVLAAGVVIVLKIRRVSMVMAGIIASLAMIYIQALLSGSLSFDIFKILLLSSPLIFFMTVMVTEPLTTPSGTKAQILYGIFIGLLSNIPFTFGSIYNSPELTLLIANLLVYPLSLRGRVMMVCDSVTKIAKDTYEFGFRASQKINFIPGQYLEWSLLHDYPDKRGIRRYFTIASSPTESHIKLAVKISENGSSYKRALATFAKGDVSYATQLSGDFVLPSKIQDKSFIFIAGGIGITPFRSQFKYLLDTNQEINGHLFYCNDTIEDIAYDALLRRSHKELGLGTTHVLNNPPDNWDGEIGYITKDMLLKHVPDVAERIVYISGPPGMVGAYKKLLSNSGVSTRNIHTDYFPGLA